MLGYADALKPSRLRGNFNAKLDEVAEVCKRYRVERIVTDQFAAEAIIDRLGEAGLHVEKVPLSAPVKTQAFGETRAKLYEGLLDLYDIRGSWLSFAACAPATRSDRQRSRTRAWREPR